MMLLAVTLVALCLDGCWQGSRPSPRPPGPVSFGAALAHVAVYNRTTIRLSIAFRPAAGAGREVVIGTVEAGARRRLAPIPAGEAIILVARTDAGGEYSLPARSFQLGQQWLWEIPADTRFRAPGPP
jgi:hypothetical protein